jgi:glycosyltransferase involved in cell wall biosynthesis
MSKTGDSPMLTIAIPTYNRNERLNKSLRLLLPQLQEHVSFCRLLLLDNCSPTPIADTLPAVLGDFPQVQYQIVRNKQNIGANANILRCFELCETEWIWCLSDDDPVLPDALATIRQHVEAHPDCIYFNFPFDGARQQIYFTTGIEEFIDKLDLSANLPWISSSVHRTSNLQVNLKYGYQFAYSMLPHVAMLLFSLGLHGRCCLSTAHVMAQNTEPTPFEERWSMVSFAMGAPTVYDIPVPFASRQALAQKLLVTQSGESISLRTVVFQLLIAYFQGNERTEHHDSENLLYHYDQIIYRNYYLRQRLGSRLGLKVAGYRWLVRFPHLAAWLLARLGRPVTGSAARRQDRYERI